MVFLLDKVVDLVIDLFVLSFQAETSRFDFILGFFKLVFFVKKLGNVSMVEFVGARRLFQDMLLIRKVIEMWIFFIVPKEIHISFLGNDTLSLILLNLFFFIFLNLNLQLLFDTLI